MDAFSQMQSMHGVREPRLERRHQYQTMCGAENDTCGTDTIQLSGAASQTRSVQREAVAYSRRPIEIGWEKSVRRYSFNLYGRGKFFVSFIAWNSWRRSLQSCFASFQRCPLCQIRKSGHSEVSRPSRGLVRRTNNLFCSRVDHNSEPYQKNG